MADAALTQSWSQKAARLSGAYHVGHLILAVAFCAFAVVSQERFLTLAFSTCACVLIFFLISRVAQGPEPVVVEHIDLSDIEELFIDDLLPTFVSALNGDILWQNRSARQAAEGINQFRPSIAAFLEDHLPNASAKARRLSQHAQDQGRFTERLIGSTGHLDVHVQTLGNNQLWRFVLKDSNPSVEEHDIAMLTVARKGTILFMNQSAKALIGKRIKSIEQLFATGMPMNGTLQTLQTTDGVMRVRIDIQHLQADRLHIIITPVADDIKNKNYALKDLPIPLLQLSLNGTIEHANTSALTLLGYSNLKGYGLSEIFDGHGVLIDDWIEKAKEPHSTIDAEFLRVQGAKKETFVQVALKRINSQPDPSLVAILTDATKLKSLEAQFVQSQKMQAIGQLAGGVAHDFNNLLTAISGHCDLMLLRHDPGDQDYADLMQVHQNSNRAAGLVSQLLAFSRKQTLQLEHLDLRNTLSDLTHLLNRLVGETVTLTLTHDPVLRAVRADKRQLEQVIMNLVVNARDAMPDGGDITIQTESMTLSAPLKRDRVTVPVGDYIVVRVRDEGIGIDEESLQKIFEPFYTTKRVGEGTGLGLSTAYGIVKQTGGFIFADSRLGVGTCFSLLFPASDQKDPIETRSSYERLAPSKELCSGVVLLVEDEAPVRAFATRALSMRGFTVIEAESAEKALELLEDTALHVDVFVTDVVMPGMDGPTWVQEALIARPNVNVVFVSGYAEGAFQGKNPKFLKSVFLPKPFSLAELTSTVQGQLDV